MLRYADFRIDGSSLQTLPDGSVKVTGQLTHPGIFSYRNPDGTERREYRPGDEVFKKAALETFAGAPVTINHPRQPDGQRLVTAGSWKRDAIGHLGENVREDNGHVVADFYIRDAAAVEQVKSRRLQHISCGYSVDFDPTPGTTPEGQRYDGVQRNIRGNHVALLPSGVPPRGGAECVLRLDSNGDELKWDVDLETLNATIAALKTELASARTDAADVAKLRSDLAAAQEALTALKAQLEPARLDALVEARGTLVATAKAAGVETAGKSNLQIKRAIVAKRTPDLAARVDSMGEETVDAVLSVYVTQPHPSMTSAVSVVTAPLTARADASETAIPKVADLYAKSVADSRNAWKNSGEKVT